MPKHHEKKHQQAGVVLLGAPSEFIKKFALSSEDEAYCLEQLTNEGPEHKQVYAILLLQRMNKLIAAIEKSSGETFTPQKGHEMEFGKHDKVANPIALPSSALRKDTTDDVVKAAAKSPEHEGVLFNALLQAIEWSLKTAAKKDLDN